MNNMIYKVLIFDLDNCLLDARSMGTLFDPAFSAIREANDGSVSQQVLEEAIEQCWYTAFNTVVEHYGLTEKMRQAGMAQFRQLRISKAIKGYDDIDVIPQFPLRRYLVTSGFRVLQESKIDALGIRGWFDHILIDDVDEALQDLTGAHGKLAFFERIVALEGCRPSELVVVGDNPLSELGAGHTLGATTVQTLRPGVAPWDLADHQISSLAELKDIVLSGGNL